MRRLLLPTWIVFLFITSIDGEFLLQPKSVLWPLYGVAHFNCSVINESIVWNLQCGSTKLNWPLHTSILSARGISAVQWESGLRVNSLLFVNATVANNGTTVACRAIKSRGIESSDIATLNVYGPPRPPQNLTVAATGDGEIVIQWAAPFAFGTQLIYKVLVQNMVTGETSESSRFYGEMFKYFDSSSNRRLCDSYRFNVMAENAAGTSNLSQPIVTTIPRAPRVTVFAVIQSSINATVSFNMRAQFCQDFPLEVYYIKITDAVNYNSINLGPYYPSGGYDTEITTCLQPNSKYIYTVTAGNAVGNTSSPPKALYTTDVQSSKITGSDHQLNVTCHFAQNTRASGCAVYTEKEGGVLYWMIPRENDTAKAVIRTEFSVDCYNISVVDWEEDGSIGSLQVPINNAISYEALQSDSHRCEDTSVPLLLPTSLIGPQPSAATLSSLSSTSLLLQPTSLGINLDTSLKAQPADNSSIGFISAGVVGGVAVLSLVAVVAMVLFCNMKTRKTVVSFVFPRDLGIGSTFTLPAQESVTPKPTPCLTCHSLHRQLVTNQNSDLEMVHYDAVCGIDSVNNTGPQPYEELLRPYKASVSGTTCNPAPNSDYAVLSEVHSYCVLQNDVHDPDAARYSFPEYAEIDSSGPSPNHQYELTEDVAAVYEGLYERLPTAGSNV